MPVGKRAIVEIGKEIRDIDTMSDPERQARLQTRTRLLRDLSSLVKRVDGHHGTFCRKV